MRDFYYSDELAAKQKKLGISEQYFVNQAGQRLPYNMTSREGGGPPLADYKQLGLTKEPLALGKGVEVEPIYGVGPRDKAVLEKQNAFKSKMEQLESTLSVEQKAALEKARNLANNGGYQNNKVQVPSGINMNKLEEMRKNALDQMRPEDRARYEKAHNM